MGSLSGKTIVVTGGGQGIGGGISRALLDAGARLFIVQRSALPEALAVQSEVHWIQADLAQPARFQLLERPLVCPGQKQHDSVARLACGWLSCV